MTGITRGLSQFVADISYDGLPGAVRERVKLLVLDLVGIALRARHDADSTPAMMAAVQELGPAERSGGGPRGPAGPCAGGGGAGEGGGAPPPPPPQCPHRTHRSPTPRGLWRSCRAGR